MPEGRSTQHRYWGVKCPKCARFFALQEVMPPDAGGRTPEIAEHHLSRRIMCDRCATVFRADRKNIVLHLADAPLDLYRD